MSTQTDVAPGVDFSKIERVGVLLLAYAPGAASVDRCRLTGRFTVGRRPECELMVGDKRMSGVHFSITRRGSKYILKDLDSRNGTFLDGLPLDRKTPLESGAVIRAGQSLFLFHQDGGCLLKTPPIIRHGIMGGFHVRGIIDALNEAALSRRNILLSGESGTGKELAAGAIASMLNKQLFPFNAARVASKEEAASTLFGVAPRFFSNVDARQGLIETAAGNVLFIDELHNLSEEIQRGLLRVMESGEVSRMGEDIPRKADVRFVVASNAGGETKGLAHDLYARLRQVTLPPLHTRRADIPDIFVEILASYLTQVGVPVRQVSALLSADHFETLMLDGFPADNVRGLVDLADRISTRIAVGHPPKAALSAVFGEQYGEGPVASRATGNAEKSASRYEQNKTGIIAAYHANKENISETEKALKRMGLRCSRRWLAFFLDKWGER